MATHSIQNAQPTSADGGVVLSIAGEVEIRDVVYGGLTLIQSIHAISQEDSQKTGWLTGWGKIGLWDHAGLTKPSASGD